MGEVLSTKQALGAGLALFSLWLGQVSWRWRPRKLASA
jgi:probable blue pigment (indigoidine) exporter